MSLPAPGALVIHDHRPPASAAPSSPSRPLRIIQWNVERNLCADAIHATLARLNPDILLLQEIDIQCERSGRRDHFHDICSRLHMLGAFVAEFEEIESPVRVPRDQGGGVHGNAILTRFPATFRAIEHPGNEFDWEADGEGIGEPRRGKRCVVVAEIELPPFWSCPKLVCYSMHLEVFTGILGRTREFSAVLEDIEQHYPMLAANGDGAPTPIVVGGDLNTLGHHVARAPWFRYTRDRYRWLLPPFSTEPEFWHRYVLSQHTAYADGKLEQQRRRLAPGLATAPNPGLWDPWDVRKDVTLERGYGINVHVPAVLNNGEAIGIRDRMRYALAQFRRWSGTIFWGKLDWMLVRGVEVTRREIGNADYLESDHRCLLIEVEREKPVLPDAYHARNEATASFEEGIVSRSVFRSWHQSWCDRRRAANPWFGSSSPFSTSKAANGDDEWIDMDKSFWQWWAMEWAKVGVGVAAASAIGYAILRKV